MERPKTRYAKSGDLHIAYQTLGQGPSDIVFLFPYLTHVEAGWDIPQIAHLYVELARLGRVVLFDAAGSGMSDPAPGLTRTLDSWTNDVVAVMDTVGIARATILCTDSAGGKAMLFAATYPERVSNLILINTTAKVLRADDYPEGMPVEGRKRFLDWYLPQWAKGTLLRYYSKTTDYSKDDIERHARLERHVASPGAVRQNLDLLLDMDVREALPLIQAPTLVVHRADNRVFPAAQGRYLATHIPNSKYVELPGDSHGIWWGDVKGMLDEISEFLTGVRQVSVTNRALATILFSDIVGSTELAAKLGDQRWRELLDRHDKCLEEAVGRYQGRLVKKTGDGGLATFQGPTRAIEAARAILGDGTRAVGLDVRIGVHTGECELRGDDVGGIAVHIASRIAGLAQGGELLVSRTVKDLVIGSGIAFEDRGMHPLKGIPDQWHLLSVIQ